MKQFVIVDIDGTISDFSERAAKYLTPGNKDWDAFYEHCDEDAPFERVCTVVSTLIKSGMIPIFLTGHPIRVIDQIDSWLDKYFGNLLGKDSLIFCKKDRDLKPDFLYKREVYEKLLANTGVKPYNTVIFEDRKSVVAMWRDLGFTCFQVADGNY